MPVIVPFEKLNPETLENLIEEFVSREGTDSGYVKGSLAESVVRVREQLKLKLAFIVYDEETESCNIIPAETLNNKRSQKAE